MARAFIASVPLAVVLVAALVVPLAVIPGTFGFDAWPASRGEQVTERQVRLAPPKVDVVAVRPRRSVPERQPVVVAARPRPATTTVAIAPAPRRSPVAAAPAPKPDRPARSSSPQQPQQPQPQPAPDPTAPQPQPPTKGDENLLANGDVPVARELPQQEAPGPQPEPQAAPVPTPPPVAAPVGRVAPPEPCHGGGKARGPQGDGDAQQ
jgi:hypothetical protein